MRENSQFCKARIRLWFFAIPNLREDALAKVNGSISPNEIVETPAVRGRNNGTRYQSSVAPIQTGLRLGDEILISRRGHVIA